MNTKSQSVVLELTRQLADDEFKLLMAIAITAQSHEGRLYPNWVYISLTTGYTNKQCNRLLRGLIDRRIVTLGRDPLLVALLLDHPKAPCVLSSECGLRINSLGGKHDRRSENH